MPVDNDFGEVVKQKVDEFARYQVAQHVVERWYDVATQHPDVKSPEDIDPMLIELLKRSKEGNPYVHRTLYKLSERSFVKLCFSLNITRKDEGFPEIRHLLKQRLKHYEDKLNNRQLDELPPDLKEKAVTVLNLQERFDLSLDS